MANYVATNIDGSVTRKVSVCLWWPGRKVENEQEMPRGFVKLVRRCRKSGSKYLVYAYTVLPDIGTVAEYSRCMDIDQPGKRYGRDKALGRLRGTLLHLGYDLVPTGQ